MSQLGIQTVSGTSWGSQVCHVCLFIYEFSIQSKLCAYIVFVYMYFVTMQGLTLASDIVHLTNKICKCPIDVSYKRTNVLLICYKGGHCPIISSFTRTSRPAFFFFRAAEAASAMDRLEDIKFIWTQVCVT